MELPEMQDDAKELSEIMYEGVKLAVFNRNEARAALNWPKSIDPYMEEHTLSSDVISLKEAVDSGFNGNQRTPTQEEFGPEEDEDGQV